jgi:hypothetical protein
MNNIFESAYLPTCLRRRFGRQEGRRADYLNLAVNAV